ncbi:MAG: class I SAM-dependent methyltransferase [Bacteroidales bacterium]|nr:class I SAM-dependent methyltransferase [Bacteroidales bacterium]
MANLMHRVKEYLLYTFRKKGAHALHSPFVFEFYNKVIYDNEPAYVYSKILKARKMVLSNRNVIETVDFGSGSGEKDFSTFRARVNALAKKRSLPIKYYKLLYRLSSFLKPNNILEFGTFTGLSTTSLALGSPGSKIVTMEGCASLANVAAGVLGKNDIQGVEIAIGNFNNLLGNILEQNQVFDLVFFDGNHRKLPTLNYFNHCLEKAGTESVFIFDDIHWSPEMNEAWDEICAHPQVTLSLDLFQFGIVFFKKGIQKQHFVLRM